VACKSVRVNYCIFHYACKVVGSPLGAPRVGEYTSFVRSLFSLEAIYVKEDKISSKEK
jgi:hypothetical protein